MKPTLKINFTDFWQGFRKDNNYFYNLLSREYNLIVDENPDLLFYSCYGHDYLKYSCTRIYYIAENIRPDYTGCDYSISCDFSDDTRNFRFPLYGYYIEAYPELLNKDVSTLFRQRSREELQQAWEKKTKFCCMVVSNPSSEKRIDFFKKLDAVKRVDSGGRYLNNIGAPVADKMEFIKDYRFVISFENSAYPGYTTEKILEPILADCIPVYWGNPLIGRDFNEGRFLNHDAFPSEDALINRMLELENDPEKAIDLIAAPAFPRGLIPPPYIHDEAILTFIRGIIQKSGYTKPVAQTYKKQLHQAKLLFNRLNIFFMKVKKKLFH